MDFTVIKRAGLTQLEFSLLTGVSRTTTNLWVSGKMAPHRYIKLKIGKVVEAIQSAIEMQELPVSTAVAPTQRQLAIKEAVKSGALRLKDVVQT